MYVPQQTMMPMQPMMMQGATMAQPMQPVMTQQPWPQQGMVVPQQGVGMVGGMVVGGMAVP